MNFLSRVLLRPLLQQELLITAKRKCISVAWKSKKKPLKIEKIGGKYSVSLIPGVGRSSVAFQALTSLLLCAGAPLLWEVIRGDLAKEEEFRDLQLSVKRNVIAIKGNIDPSGLEYKPKPFKMNKNMMLRRSLDLHTFIIEIKSFRGLRHLMKIHKNVDVVMVRQNTEGAYTLLEYSPSTPNKVVEMLRVTTANNSKRVAECAFIYATKKNRKKVQCLHMDDVMPFAESTFVKAFLEVADMYPGIEHEVVNIRLAIQRFLKDSSYLDVVVMGGLEGLLLTNFLLGMIGGPNLLAGMNVGDSAVVLEPATRLREPDDLSNPTAYFLAGAGLLHLIGQTVQKLSEMIRDSVDAVFLEKTLPADMGGTAGMEEFTEAVVRQVRKRLPLVLCAYDKVPPPNPAYKPSPTDT